MGGSCSHGHGAGGHNHAPDNFNKAFAIAVTLNFAFVVLQAIYAIKAHSMSLLADASHNFGDVLGLAMAWFASWLLTRAANERYSYGYRRTSILAAMANALILMATSGIIAKESIDKLIHLHGVNEIIVIVVASIGIVINGGTALLFMRGRKNDLNIKGAYMHLAFDALISIGVVIAGFLILWTGWFWLDPVVGLLIVVMIVYGTWGLLKDSVRLLLDGVPSHIAQEEVKAYLLTVENAKEVHDLHIWGLSTKEVALTAHLVIDGDMLTSDQHRKIDDDLKHQFGIVHATIQVEKYGSGGDCHRREVCSIS